MPVNAALSFLQEKRFEAEKTWFYKKMLAIEWAEQVINKEVLKNSCLN